MADWLDVPTHVLRFWESRFSQIKPVKRAGGRRYYRPSDMRVIGGVKVLLHDQGMTIRGVQKLFREEGVKHVSTYSPALYGEPSEVIEARPLQPAEIENATRPAAAARTTHDAAPAPVTDEDVIQDTPSEEVTAASAVFRHKREERPETSGGKDVVDERAPADDTASPVDAGQPEPARPAIPPTPDVPDHDPADDDENHQRGPGIAARLAVQKASDLKAQRDLIDSAAARLRTLLERAS